MVFKTGPNGKQLRGLALLSPERRREIAIKGGKTSKKKSPKIIVRHGKRYRLEK